MADYPRMTCIVEMISCDAHPQISLHPTFYDAWGIILLQGVFTSEITLHGLRVQQLTAKEMFYKVCNICILVTSNGKLASFPFASEAGLLIVGNYDLCSYSAYNE